MSLKTHSKEKKKRRRRRHLKWSRKININKNEIKQNKIFPTEQKHWTKSKKENLLCMEKKNIYIYRGKKWEQNSDKNNYYQQKQNKLKPLDEILFCMLFIAICLSTSASYLGFGKYYLSFSHSPSSTFSSSSAKKTSHIKFISKENFLLSLKRIENLKLGSINQEPLYCSW